MIKSKSLMNSRGLTLIEVLIVVFIISVILAIAVPNYTQSTARANEKLCSANQKMVEAQLELYSIEEGSQVPDGTDFTALINNGYLKEAPTCPSGGTYSIKGLDLECTVHPTTP